MPFTTSDQARAGLEGLLGERTNLLCRAQRLTPAPAARAWELVADASDYNAWLIAWGADSVLGAHDHGASHAAIHVLGGSLIEWYRDAGSTEAWTVREVPTGRSIRVPASRVHEVHNATSEIVVSLHVYSPPLQTTQPHEPVRAIGRARILV